MPIKEPVINQSKKLIISICFTILFSFIFLSFFTQEFETRYYLTIIPFLYLLMSIIISRIFQKDKLFASILLFLLLFTNVINFIPYNITSLLNLDMNSNITKLFITSPIPYSYLPDGNQTTKSLKYESYLLNYVSSYYMPVTDEVSVLVDYLNGNAKPGDTIAAFGTEPWTNTIQFYTDLKLVNNLRPNYGSWAADTYYPNASRFYSLVYCPDELVDWAVLPGPYGNGYEEITKIYLDETKYEKIQLRKSLKGMENDIWLYSFYPDYQNSPDVVLYKRIR